MQHLPGHQTGLLALLKSHPNPKVATVYATGMNFMKRDFLLHLVQDNALWQKTHMPAAI